MRRSLPALVVLFAISVQPPQSARAQAPDRGVTTPKQYFGFNMGDDYCLANYKQLKGYWEKLERESDRIKVVRIGTTEEGRPQLAAIVTSPANHRELARFKQTSRRLALAEGVSEAAARKLATGGKAVVWIDGGLHASETLCAQVLIETVYQFLASNDEETLRILDDVVILFVHANPDGHDLVADWYMREKEPTKRSMAGLPRLYQKYVGHDNNRDFYANTQAETKNLNRFMYREWVPQIMYNHHQSGPAGTVLFCPPFRDPFNYFCDPLVLNGIDAVGAAMMQRFLAVGKPGATSRSGAPYSASVQVLNGSAFRNGSAEGAAKALDEATGVWLDAAPNGEDSEANSGLAAALKKVVSRGGVLAGEGALAAVDSFDLLPGLTLAAVGPKGEELEWASASTRGRWSSSAATGWRWSDGARWRCTIAASRSNRASRTTRSCPAARSTTW